MPELSDKEVEALIRRGIKPSRIEAMAGRRLRNEEKTLSEKLAGIRQIEKQINGKDAKSCSERIRNLRNRDRLVPYADPEDAKRRKRLEKDPAKWLRWYLEDRFPLQIGRASCRERV